MITNKYTSDLGLGGTWARVSALCRCGPNLQFSAAAARLQAKQKGTYGRPSFWAIPAILGFDQPLQCWQITKCTRILVLQTPGLILMNCIYAKKIRLWIVFFQVIAENLSTAVVADLQTLVKSMKDDRRKVTTLWRWDSLPNYVQTPALYTQTHTPILSNDDTMEGVGGGMSSYMQHPMLFNTVLPIATSSAHVGYLWCHSLAPTEELMR